MKSRETKLAAFALLVVFFLCFRADGQTRITGGDTAPPSVTLPSDLMNRELTTLYNRRLKLADYSGKITIINLFASWCAPCRENLWDLIKIKQKYAGHGVEVIGIVAAVNDHDLASVRRFVRLQQINFPVVWGNEGFGESLVKVADDRSFLGLEVLPQTFIIGGDGRILKRFEGFNPSITPVQMRKVLDQAKKERRTG